MRRITLLLTCFIFLQYARGECIDWYLVTYDNRTGAVLYEEYLYTTCDSHESLSEESGGSGYFTESRCVESITLTNTSVYRKDINRCYLDVKGQVERDGLGWKARVFFAGNDCPTVIELRGVDCSVWWNKQQRSVTANYFAYLYTEQDVQFMNRTMRYNIHTINENFTHFVSNTICWNGL